MPRSMKELLRSGEVTLGGWITLAHPAIAEIMARAGFDWIAVDLEHSVISLREAEELIRIVELCGVIPLARVSSNDRIQIKRLMDAGAHGVIVPMVNSRAAAEQAVAAVKYPPGGSRGVGLARAQGYGTRFNEYKNWVERESVVIVQVEHIRAVDNLSKILDTDGVDGFMVGPYDLSGSLGVPGQFENPRMAEAMAAIQQIAQTSKVAPGYHVVSPRPELVNDKIREGYRFIAYGVDILFLGEACHRGLQEIKNHK